MKRVLAILLLVGLIGCGKQETPVNQFAKNCELIRREKVGSQYCGKACFQPIYRYEYSCPARTVIFDRSGS